MTGEIISLNEPHELAGLCLGSNTALMALAYVPYER
jgi:hypothetical protein